MGKLLNKKAQTPGDVILLVVFLFALAIGGVVSTYIYAQFFEGVSANAELNSSAVAMEVFEAGNTVNQRWDYLILFLFVGMAIALMILGYFIDVDSIFLPLYVIALIIGVVLASILTYVWENFSTNSTFITTVNTSFPITNHIITNLALYVTIMGVLSMVATYAKVRGENAI